MNPFQTQIKSEKKSSEDRRELLSVDDHKTMWKCYISNGNNSQMIEKILRSFGYQRQYKEESFSQIQWILRIQSINWNLFQDGKQLINHIQGEDFFTTKLQLYQSLESYSKVYSMSKTRPKYFLELKEFVPQTYKIDERTDRDLFVERFQDQQMWICKPSELNRGEGISLIRNRNDLHLIFENQSKSIEQTTMNRRLNMKRIVQKYIDNPLLINKKKFDLRCYMLISSVQPLIVFYHPGYLRLSIVDFHLNDENLQTHLTNQCIQKHDQRYKQVKENTIMTIEEFNDYINEEIHRNQVKTIEVNWVIDQLQKRIEQILLNVIESVRMRMKKRLGSFGFYGFDLMIDQDFHVWLIEINANPSLSTTTNKLSNLLPEIVEESLALSIECFDKVRRFQSIRPLKSLNKFRLIYDEIELNRNQTELKKKSLFCRRSISIHREKPNISQENKSFHRKIPIFNSTNN